VKKFEIQEQSKPGPFFTARSKPCQERKTESGLAIPLTEGLIREAAVDRISIGLCAACRLAAGAELSIQPGRSGC
jgi:hypothetical protein